MLGLYQRLPTPEMVSKIISLESKQAQEQLAQLDSKICPKAISSIMVPLQKIMRNSF